jgi:hypothetical protein
VQCRAPAPPHPALFSEPELVADQLLRPSGRGLVLSPRATSLELGWTGCKPDQTRCDEYERKTRIAINDGGASRVMCIPDTSGAPTPVHVRCTAPTNASRRGRLRDQPLHNMATRVLRSCSSRRWSEREDGLRPMRNTSARTRPCPRARHAHFDVHASWRTWSKCQFRRGTEPGCLWRGSGRGASSRRMRPAFKKPLRRSQVLGSLTGTFSSSVPSGHARDASGGGPRCTSMP